MANYCVGELKFRGEFKNIKKFLEREFGSFTKNDDEDVYHFKKDTFFGNTRAYVYEKCSVYFSNVLNETDDIETQESIMVQFAWYCEVKELERISKQYQIDVKFHGFERGMEFVQIVECHKNGTTIDKAIKYDDYFWECPMSNLGG